MHRLGIATGVLRRVHHRKELDQFLDDWRNGIREFTIEPPELVDVIAKLITRFDEAGVRPLKWPSAPSAEQIEDADEWIGERVAEARTEQDAAKRSRRRRGFLNQELVKAGHEPAPDERKIKPVYLQKSKLTLDVSHLRPACHPHLVSRSLTGRFNSHMRDACFLFADEAYWPGDKQGEGTIKGLITEPTLFIEGKGKDEVQVPNMLHILMASNEDWVVPAGEYERRYVVLKASDHKRQNEGYFAAIYKQLQSGGYEAMLHDLLNRDLGDWHPRRILINEELRQQQIRSLKPLDAWVLRFFEDGELPEGLDVEFANRALSHSKPDLDGRNPKNGLLDLARENPKLKHMNDQVLTAHLEAWGCTPWRSNKARGWQFPSLAQCRAKWEEKYPGWQWEHPDVTEWQVGDNTAFDTTQGWPGEVTQVTGW